MTNVADVKEETSNELDRSKQHRRQVDNQRKHNDYDHHHRIEDNKIQNRQEAEKQIQNVEENERQCANVIKKSNFNQSDIQPTKKRFLILLLFSSYSMINSLQWIYLCSITNIVSSYYNVNNLAVNLTSMLYMIVYIPLIVPASWCFERIGMRNSILLGSFGNALGSIIKCLGCNQDGFLILIGGQTLVAASQLFVLSVPPRLASVWFPDNQVSLATACGIFGNQLGIALGFVLPQLIVSSDENSPIQDIQLGIKRLFYSIASFSILITILILILFDHQPAKAPGLARLQQILQEERASGISPLVDNDDNQRTQTSYNTNGDNQNDCNKLKLNYKSNSFIKILTSLITERNFILLMVSYGLNVGVFYGISTILNQMISPKTLDESLLVGRLGLLMVISGMLGSVISGYLLDKTHKYRLINTTLYSMSLTALITFAIAIQIRNNKLLYLTVFLFGYFMTGYLFIGFEMSNEITWPIPESISAGLLNLSAQIFGVLHTYLGSLIVDSRGNLAANIFYILSILIGLLVTLMIKTQLKRQNAVEM